MPVLSHNAKCISRHAEWGKVSLIGMIGPRDGKESAHLNAAGTLVEAPQDLSDRRTADGFGEIVRQRLIKAGVPKGRLQVNSCKYECTVFISSVSFSYHRSDDDEYEPMNPGEGAQLTTPLPPLSDGTTDAGATRPDMDQSTQRSASTSDASAPRAGTDQRTPQATGTPDPSASPEVHHRRRESWLTANAKLYVLAIAIDRYPQPSAQLSDDVVTAKEVVTVVTLDAGSLYDGKTVITLYDKEATVSNITKAIKSIQASLTPSDALVLYVAGHLEDNHSRFKAFDGSIPNPVLTKFNTPYRFALMQHASRGLPEESFPDVAMVSDRILLQIKSALSSPTIDTNHDDVIDSAELLRFFSTLGASPPLGAAGEPFPIALSRSARRGD
jgi:hypothetical protein